MFSAVIQLSVFQKRLTSVAGLVAKLSSYRDPPNFLLEASVKKQKIFITYADESTYIKTWLPAEVTDDGAFAIPSVILRAIRAPKGSVLTISHSRTRNGESLQLNTDTGIHHDLAALVEIDGIKNQIPENLQKMDIKFNAGVLSSLMTLACFSSTQGEDLAMLRLDFEDNVLKVATSDSYRWSYCEHDLKVSNLDGYVVMDDTIIIAREMLEPLLSLTKANETLHLGIGQRSYTMKTSEYQLVFPRRQASVVEDYDPKANYYEASAQDGEGHVIVSADALVEAFNQVCAVPRAVTGTASRVRMAIRGKDLQVSVTSELGYADVAIPLVKRKHSGIHVCDVNETYFLELLTRGLGTNVDMRWWQNETMFMNPVLAKDHPLTIAYGSVLMSVGDDSGEPEPEEKPAKTKKQKG